MIELDAGLDQGNNTWPDGIQTLFFKGVTMGFRRGAGGIQAW
ncbi:hypothetical protein ACLBOM_06700 [Escherichia coli]